MKNARNWCWTIAMVLWVMAPILQVAWMPNVPHHPDAAQGFIHPENIRGAVYYFNTTQRNTQFALEWGALLFGAVGVAFWNKTKSDALRWRG